MSASDLRSADLAVVSDPSELRAVCRRARAEGQRVAFVPTMGALHAGHLALVREARQRASLAVVSIFVNPTQFGPAEDFARYPRDLAGDLAKLAGVGPVLVFAPERGDLYPASDDTRVRVGSLAAPLCGRFRPGHFEGVATVVAKLFALVGGCDAIFGRKDYQQWLVVRRMARDLFYPVEVVGHPIVREADGVAMSSRNAYLSADERSRARSLVEGLDAAARAFAAGEKGARELEAIARASVAHGSSAIDYVEVRDAETLSGFDGPRAQVGAHAVLAVACHIGRTRLIDNVVLGKDAPPLG